MTDALKLFSLFLVGCIVGCGGSLSETDIRTAQDSLEEAKTLAKAGSPAEALPKIETALEAGGLDPDQYAEALLYRAWCHADTGNLEQAKSDFSEAEQGAPAPGLMHFARGVILEAEGDKKAAGREFSKAKKLDPSLKRS